MKTSISEIVKKYLSGRFSPETEERVQKWLIDEANREEKQHASFEYWNKVDESITKGTYSALKRVNFRIGYFSKQTLRTPLYRSISRIAAILLPVLIIVGGYFYYKPTHNNLIEVTMAYGQEKHLFLPDSSEIWINAGTTIRYPEKFKGDKRTVYLDGEAYFSVRRDEEKPFIVETEKLSVNVLGTRFNVKAYANEENTTATLTSGKIQVLADNESYILKPDQQLIYNLRTSATTVRQVPPEETYSWLSGHLIFNNASLKEIIHTLERHFDIQITDNTLIPESKSYTVKFFRNENKEEILGILQDVIGFDYRQQGRNIILTKK